MIIDFSTLGSGDGRQVELCDECRYHIKISYRDRPAQAAWLSGAQIKGQYSTQDVKIVIRGMKRCKHHSGSARKTKPRFLEAALKSGIDVNEDVDDYRSQILKRRHPDVRG